jgi:2-polyprenyl-3-methyl-5-hydroxy-6-metoxy-1,4-benzoquinol methylase
MVNDTASSILCPQCHSATTLAFISKDYNRGVTDKSFYYYQCSHCGLIFLSPVPAELGNYYTGNYYRVPHTVEELAVRAQPEQYKVEIARDYIQRGKLLDIGASVGAFAYLAKQAGYDAEVIEMDKDCCAFIESKLNIKAYNSSSIDNALSKLENYDIISMWQVIEHVPNPWAILPLLVEHLNPGGILILAAPNPDSLQFRLFKTHWVHLDAPRHVELIPYKLLVQVLKKYGMKPVLQTTADANGAMQNRYGYLSSLANTSTQPAIKTLLKIFGLGLFKLLTPFEKRDMNGCCYTLVFQRE